jgi:hypothetical protein
MKKSYVFVVLAIAAVIGFVFIQQSGILHIEPQVEPKQTVSKSKEDSKEKHGVVTGQMAPGFTLPSAMGVPFSLSSLHGNYIVLEWFNHECPFVRKQYDTGAIQKLQQNLASKGVGWISIISSAEGKQGYVTGPEALENKVKDRSMANVILLDTEGSVGRTYGAKNTPQMFIIDQQGVVVYQGAIDSAASSAGKSGPGKVVNYVEQAFDEIFAGRPVSVATTKPYGCSVKY